MAEAVSHSLNKSQHPKYLKSFSLNLYINIPDSLHSSGTYSPQKKVLALHSNKYLSAEEEAVTYVLGKAKANMSWASSVSLLLEWSKPNLSQGSASSWPSQQEGKGEAQGSGCLGLHP